MAEPPKFERSNPIKPAQAVTGFAQAFESVGKAAYGQIERMSSDIAQESANKFAQVMGIEAAQKDVKAGKSRNLIPLGQADKLFNQTYQQEQAQELGFQGQQMLQAFMKTASKSPTGDALGEYEQYGKQGIEQLINQAPKAAQSNLRRHLEDTYVTGYNKLSERVEAAGRAYTEANQLKQANQLDSNITNRTLEDGKDAGLEALKRKLGFIEEAENRYIATGGMEGYDPNTAAIAREQATERWQAAAHQAEWQAAHNEGKGSEYLQQLRESPPKGLDATQQDALIKSVLGYAGEYQAALNAQQGINYLKYATMVDTGQMTEAALLQARKDVSEGQFAQLERYIATRNTEANNATKLYNEAAPNLDNAAFMAKYSSGDIDAIFGKRVELYNAAMSEQTGEPHEATLGERAMLAQGINAPIASLQKQLSRAANYGDTNQATEAVRAMVMLDNNNLGVTLAGISDKDKAILSTFKDLRENARYTPEESLKLARDQSNVDENTKQSRRNRWKEMQKEKDYYKNTPDKIKRIGDNIGAKRGWFRERNLVPTGLDVSFDRLMNSLVPLYDNPEKAEQEAFQQLARTTKPTEVNNRNELMKMAPDPMIWNDRFRAVKEFVDKSKAQQAAGGSVLNELDWPDAPDVESLYNKPPIPGDLVINVDGKPRKIVIAGDLTTQWGADLIPSYSLSYLDDDGVPMALMDLDTGQQARWIPDYQGMQARLKTPEQIRTEAIEKAHSMHLKAAEDERINEVGLYDPMIGGIR
jgi:hypothetical protein